MTAEQKSTILAVLKSAASVFSDMDGQSWLETEFDFYYGRVGTCPVAYDAAQQEVARAIEALEQ